MDTLEDVVFGSIAGVLSKYFEYPFDTIKVRLQSQPDHLPLHYTGPLDCFRKSLNSAPGGSISGVLSLYRGISSPVAGAALENSCLFFCERIGQEIIRNYGLVAKGERLPLSALWLTGALAGTVTSFALTPFELIKCRIQASSYNQSPCSPLRVIKDVWCHQGFKGFWTGQTGTLIRETVGSASWFGSKESVSSFFRNINQNSKSPTFNPSFTEAMPLPLYQQIIAGASAGVGYNFISFPADTIKSRIQTSGLDGGQRSILQETVALWTLHGLRGFYRGCSITVMRSAPSSALIFCIFDALKENMSFIR